jgi:hypothetical protein
MTLTKESLIDEINNLKVSIQELIDKKKQSKNTLNKQEISLLNSEKDEKIKNLEDLSSKLKEIIKKEKSEQTLLNQIKKAENSNDSITYFIAKKNKNTDHLEKLKETKNQRELARENYLNYMKIKEFYLKIDSDIFPAFLFFHEKVIEMYGMCPFIRIDSINNDIENPDAIDDDYYKKKFNDLRKNWLEETCNNGKTYYDLYNEIVLKTQISKIKSEINTLEKKIDKIVFEILSDSQSELYKKSIELLQEYINCNIKTKKLKEKFKILIHNLSILFSETGIHIDKYLTLKFNINLPINIIPSSELSIENDHIIKFFNEDLSLFSNLLEHFNQKQKYVINIKKNLDQELFTFISKTNNLKNNLYKQEGKYFKTWANLNNEEKYERFESYSEFYAKKCLKDLYKEESKNQLFNLIKTNYDNKKLNYRHFVWKTNLGILEKIKFINFNNETYIFYLDDELNNDKLNTKLKKSISKKTIFTNENEKIINEEILKYIIKTQNEEDNNSNKDDYINIIKDKLKIKKFNKDDKQLLITKFNEIKTIIFNL